MFHHHTGSKIRIQTCCSDHMTQVKTAPALQRMGLGVGWRVSLTTEKTLWETVEHPATTVLIPIPWHCPMAAVTTPCLDYYLVCNAKGKFKVRAVICPGILLAQSSIWLCPLTPNREKVKNRSGQEEVLFAPVGPLLHLYLTWRLYLHSSS